jgi:hypothetical protein
VSQQAKNPKAREPKRPRKWFTTGRVLVGGSVIVAVPLAIMALLNTVSVPTVQADVNMPGMAPHLLSLWFELPQDQGGPMEITGQLLDAGGTPVPANSMRFSIVDNDDSLLSTEAGEPLPGSNRGDLWRFRGVVQTPTAGDWDLDVELQMSGRSATARIAVER